MSSLIITLGRETLPNGIDLEGMFRTGSRWSSIAWLLAIIGLLASVLVVAILSTYGSNGTLWALWIMIFWLNITTFILAYGSSSQLTAIYLAIRGTRDESWFSSRIWGYKLKPDSSRLLGVRVSVEVQEGNKEDLVTLKGTTTRYWKNPDGSDSLVVHLDCPTKWGRSTGESAGLPELILENLLIWPVFKGDSLTKLGNKFGRNFVPCGIGKLKLEPTEEMRINPIGDYDRSKLAYFSHGVIRKTQ